MPPLTDRTLGSDPAARRQLAPLQPMPGGPLGRLVEPSLRHKPACPPPSLASAVSSYLDLLEKHRRIAAAAARELEGMEGLGARY